MITHFDRLRVNSPIVDYRTINPSPSYGEYIVVICAKPINVKNIIIKEFVFFNQKQYVTIKNDRCKDISLVVKISNIELSRNIEKRKKI